MHVAGEGEAVVQVRFGLFVLDVSGVDLGVEEGESSGDAILLGGEEVEGDGAGVVGLHELLALIAERVAFSLVGMGLLLGDFVDGEILRALEIDHQYVAQMESAQAEQIALIRSLGRKAGRHLAWKVRTFQTDPSTRADGLVVVAVVVVESTSAEQARIRERSEFLIRNMK